MKWLPFFIVLFLFSCKPGSKEKGAVDLPGKTNLSPKDYSGIPWETEDDSGFFRGYPSITHREIVSHDSNQLFTFISGILRQKDLALEDSQSLAHTVFIDQKAGIRYDTLRNKKTLIVSIYNFVKGESQSIRLNGKIIRDYKWDGSDSTQENIMALEGETFRHFSFRGKEYYYIMGRVMDGHYGSIHTLVYHLVYSQGAASAATFLTCRFEAKLFGDVDGDNRLDYLDFDNSDFCTGVPLSDNVILQLYSCDDKGSFVLQKDKLGKPFFIEGRTGDDLAQDSFILQKLYWPWLEKMSIK